MKQPIRATFFMFFTVLSLSLSAQQAEFGLASFYDDSFQGSMTAYNVKYDKNDLTTAHKIYPFGTLLRVTRLDTKKSVVVKVTDKGPYMKGRVVDLSKKAAQQLGIIESGSAEVKVELYQKASKEASETSERIATTTTTTNTTNTTDIPTKRRTPALRPVNNTTPTPKATATKTAAKTTPKGAAPAKLVKQDYKQYGLYKIQLERPVKKGYGVQVASLANYESVMKQIADLQAKSFTNILVSAEKGTNNKPVYKVILGPHDTEAAATNYKSSLKKRYKINGFIVDLEALTY